MRLHPLSPPTLDCRLGDQASRQNCCKCEKGSTMSDPSLQNTYNILVLQVSVYMRVNCCVSISGARAHAVYLQLPAESFK